MSHKPTKSAFIRELIRAYCADELQYRPGFATKVEHGFSRVRYRVMTDETGKKWDVPVTEDLREHDPERSKHTFVRITDAAD